MPGFVNSAYFSPSGARSVTVMLKARPFTQAQQELQQLTVMTSICQMHGAPSRPFRPRTLDEADAYAPLAERGALQFVDPAALR